MTDFSDKRTHNRDTRLNPWGLGYVSFFNGLALLPQQFVLLCTGDVSALKPFLVVSRLMSPIIFLNIRHTTNAWLVGIC